MIEIASAATPQLVSPSPLVVRPRRRARPKMLRPHYHQHGRRENIRSHRRQRTPLALRSILRNRLRRSFRRLANNADDAQIPIARGGG